MAPAVMNVFILLIILPAGYSEVVRTQEEVIATLGEDAHFNCRLMVPKDVLQVTWHKEATGRKNHNVGTYTRRFGPVVNSAFQENVEFVHPGLESCSIVIRKVSKRDEGCYNCLYITYPAGSITGKTCLKVNELYEPRLLITQTNSSYAASVSCSVTGRPAPSVTWDVPEHVPLLNSSTTHVPHPNGTVTVTTTAVVEPSEDTLVTCVVSQTPGGPSTQADVWIPASGRPTFAGKYPVTEDTEDTEVVKISIGVAVAVTFLVVGLLSVLCGIALFLKTRSKSASTKSCDSENVTSPLRRSSITRSTTPACTPLQEENNSSVKRRPQNKSQSTSSTEDDCTAKKSLFN